MIEASLVAMYEPSFFICDKVRGEVYHTAGTGFRANGGRVCISSSRTQLSLLRLWSVLSTHNTRLGSDVSFADDVLVVLEEIDIQCLLRLLDACWIYYHSKSVIRTLTFRCPKGELGITDHYALHSITWQRYRLEDLSGFGTDLYPTFRSGSTRCTNLGLLTRILENLFISAVSSEKFVRTLSLLLW